MKRQIDTEKFLQEILSAQHNCENAIEASSRLVDIFKTKSSPSLLIVKDINTEKARLHKLMLRLKKLKIESSSSGVILLQNELKISESDNTSLKAPSVDILQTNLKSQIVLTENQNQVDNNEINKVTEVKQNTLQCTKNDLKTQQNVEIVEQKVHTTKEDTDKLKQQSSKTRNFQTILLDQFNNEKIINEKQLRQIEDLQDKFNHQRDINAKQSDANKKLNCECRQLYTINKELEIKSSELEKTNLELKTQNEFYKTQLENITNRMDEMEKEKKLLQQQTTNQNSTNIIEQKPFINNSDKSLYEKKEHQLQISSNEIYLTIEEAYKGCQKTIKVRNYNSTVETFLMTFKRGVKEGEIVQIYNTDFIVKYIKHQCFSRHGDDLVVNKQIFIKQGVRHPDFHGELFKKAYDTLLSLKGFTDSGKTVFDDGTTFC
ncbi:hypothetical protein EIN_436440 [Entamoeba invadens IP1]|uniref:Uncharacterized protein n=1 Tax=Entamoeba invadens IP1 TaxID=370355 RepID=A0A0A1U9J1_ENTIV|nr:hypothetical protein EIN_436440 [Entamoeba invadens IP1]ELP88774.1 hypothetical protein EIN_436440 [Entamoeba invadens IP1]|eukprot:XP_004255545.1 hypothetical protein EIN_436440 [Entamoeba invadens IP1]